MTTYKKRINSIFALIIIALMVFGSLPTAFADGTVPTGTETPAMTVEVSMEPVITVENAQEATNGTMEVIYKEGDLVVEFGYSYEETTEVTTEASTEASTEATSEAVDPLYKWDGTGTWGKSNNTYLFNIEDQTDKTKADATAYCVDITIGAKKDIAYTKIALSDYEKMTDAQKVKVTAILSYAEKNPVTKQSITDTQLALWYVVNGYNGANGIAKLKYDSLDLRLTEEDLAKYEAKVEYSNLEHTYTTPNSTAEIFGADGFVETKTTTDGATTVKIVADEENVPDDGFTLKVTVKGTKSTKEYYVFVPISVNSKGVYNTQPLISAVMDTFTEELTAEQTIIFTKEIKEIIKEVVPEVPVTVPEGDDEERISPNRTPIVTEIVIEEVPLAAPTVDTVTPVAPEVVQETMIPLGVTALPKTGEIPTTLFYGLGGLLGSIGIFMRRMK